MILNLYNIPLFINNKYFAIVLLVVLSALIATCSSESDNTVTPPTVTKHKVTFMENKPAGVSATITGFPNPVEITVDNGKKVTKPTTNPQLTGYIFLGWYTGTSATALETTAFAFTTKTITTDTKIFAKWTLPTQHTITYVENKPTGVTEAISGFPSPTEITVNDGEMLTKPTTDPQLIGYTFAGWYTGTSATALETTAFAFTTKTITTDTKIFAKWTLPTQHTITYVENKPTGVTEAISGFPSPTEITVNDGEMLTTPTTDPQLIGYTFAGWYSGTSATALETTAFAFTTKTITTDTKIFAKWTLSTQHTITYVENKPTGVTEAISGFPSPTEITVYNGEILTTPTTVPQLAGYTFVGWFAGTSATALETTAFAFTTTPITGDTKIFAKWGKLPTSLTLTRKQGKESKTTTVGTTLDLTTVFTVVVEPTDAIDTVTWSLSSADAPNATITDVGVLTPITASTVKVKATSTIGTQPIESSEVDFVIIPIPTRLSAERKTGQESTNAIVESPLDLNTVFVVTPTPASADRSVTWSVKSDSAVSGTIEGTMLTPSVVGIVTLIATSTVDSNISTEAIIRVTTPNRVRSVSITSNGPATIGTDYMLRATVNPVTAVQIVTWEIEGTAPEGITIEDGVLKTVAGTTLAGIVSVVATSVGLNVSGAVMRSSAQEITLNHALSLARKTEQDETKVYVSGDPVELSTVFDITPTPTGTLTWSLTQTGSIATIDATGMITGVVAGEVQVSVTETVEGVIAKSSSSVPFTVNAAVENPVTDIELITKGPFEKSNNALNVRITKGTASDESASSWSMEIVTSGHACVSISSNSFNSSSCVATDKVLPTTVRISSVAPDRNGKPLTKEYVLVTIPSIAIISGAIAIIGEPLSLKATIDGVLNVADITWSISGTAPTGVTIDSNTLTIGQSATSGETITVVTTYTFPDTSPAQTANKEHVITIRTSALPITSVLITSTGPATIGSDYTLTVTVAPPETPQTVTWAIDGTAPAGVTIENGSLKTVAGTTLAGTVSVIATSTADGTTAGTKVTSQPQAITLTHALSLARKTEQGETKVYMGGNPVDLNTIFNITPTPTGTLTWSLTQTGSIATVNAAGMIRAVAAGTVQVSVTETVEGVIAKSSSSVPFTVNVAIANPVTGVSITSNGPATIGVDYPLTVTVEPSAVPQTVTWAIQGTTPAGVTIENGVLKTVTGTTPAGIVSLIATSTHTNASGKVVVSTAQEITLNLAVTSVSITSSGPATIGSDYTLTVRVSPPETPQTVTWAIDGTAPAGVTIENGALKTVAGTTLAGTVSVLATSVGLSASGELVPSSAQEITLSHALSLARKTDQSTTVVYMGGNPVDLNTVFNITPTPTGTLTWSLTQTGSIATVNAAGMIRAVAVGTVQVSVTETVEGVIAKSSSSVPFTVNVAIANPVTGVSITSNGPATIGRDYPLTATVEPSTVPQTVTWAIQGTTPAGVTIENGVLKTVTGTTPAGIVSLIATSTHTNASGKVVSTAQEITLNLAVTSVSITSSGLATIGSDYTLTVRVSPPETPQTVTWAIDGTAPAGVTIENGALKTVAGTTLAGTVSVIATSTADGTTAGTKVTSQPQAITLKHALLLNRKEFIYVFIYTDGDPIDLNEFLEIIPKPTGTLTWSLTQTGSIATVNAAGMMRAVAAGTVQVSVTETVGGITKSSNSLKLYTQKAIANPVTNIELLTIESIKRVASHDLRVRVTKGESNEEDNVAAWRMEVISGGHPCITSTANSFSLTNCSSTDVINPVTIKIHSTARDRNDKIVSEEYVLNVSPEISITTGTLAIIGESLPLTATVNGMQNTSDIVWSIKGTPPTGVQLENGHTLLVGQTATDGNTVTVELTYTFPNSNPAQTLKKEITINLKSTAAPVTTVTVASTGPATIGTDYLLIATVLPVTATQTVTWAIQGTALAGVTIENGALKTVGGTTPAVTVSVIATSTADGTTQGTKIASQPQQIILKHPLSLERKTEQGETKVYLSGEPVDLKTVFDIRPTPTGTLAWSITETGLATIDATTGVITAVAAGVVQVSVIETVAGITKSSNSMSFTVNATIANPVTDIELITKGPSYTSSTLANFHLRSKITKADGTLANGIIEYKNSDWYIKILKSFPGCPLNSSDDYITTSDCKLSGYYKIEIGTLEFDRNGKKISKIYYIFHGPQVLVSSADTATRGTPLQLTATVGGIATTGLTWTIKDPAPTGVSIGGPNNDMLITTSTAQTGTLTVIASYTVPDITIPTDTKAEEPLPPIMKVEKTITLTR